MNVPFWIELATLAVVISLCFVVVAAAHRRPRRALALVCVLALVVAVFGELPVAGRWGCPLCGWGYGVAAPFALAALAVILAVGVAVPGRGTLPLRILAAAVVAYPVCRAGLGRWMS